MRRLLAATTLALALSPAGASAVTGGLVVQRAGGLGVVRPDGSVRVLVQGGSLFLSGSSDDGASWAYTRTLVEGSSLVVQKGRVTRAFPAGAFASAIWSPNGRYIGVTWQGTLEVIDTGTWSATRVIEDGLAKRVWGWAPGSDWLAFTSGDRVFTYDLASHAIVPISLDGESQLAIAISPDGRRLAYTSSVGSASHVTIVAVDGTSRVSPFPTSDSASLALTYSASAWSATGGHLVVQVDQSAFIVDRNGGNARRVPGSASTLAWSPNGEVLAAVDGGSTVGRIWLVRATTTTKVVDRCGGRWHPVWAPDGSTLVTDGFRPCPLLLVTRAGKVRSFRGASKAGAWSPDGRYVIGASYGTSDSWVINRAARSVGRHLKGFGVLTFTADSRAMILERNGRVGLATIGGRLPAMHPSQALSSNPPGSVAFVRGRRSILSLLQGRLVLEPASGAKASVLARVPTDPIAANPEVSPDRRWIVWKGPAGFLVRATDGSTPARVLRTVGVPVYYAYPVWSSDSTRVAVSDGSGWRMEVFSTAGAHLGDWDPRRPTGTEPHELPSPDLRTVLVSDDHARVAVRTLPGGALRTLATAPAGTVVRAEWARDSAHLVLSAGAPYASPVTISSIDVASGTAVVLGAGSAGGLLVWPADGEAFAWVQPYAIHEELVGIVGIAGSLHNVTDHLTGVPSGLAAIYWSPTSDGAILAVLDDSGTTTTFAVTVDATTVSATLAPQSGLIPCDSGGWSPDALKLLTFCDTQARIYSDAQPVWSVPTPLTRPFWASATAIVGTADGAVALVALGASEATPLTHVDVDGPLATPLPGETPLAGLVLVQAPDTTHTGLARLDGTGVTAFGPSDETTVLGWLPG